MTKPNLKPKFDPIWIDDFQDLTGVDKISPAAFIIRQVLRLERDQHTQETNLSDCQIQNLTGFSRPTIRQARKQLLDLGYIKKVGYHRYFIRKFERNY